MTESGPATDQTIPEMMDRLTGYDELFIEQRFKRNFAAMCEGEHEDDLKVTRALVAVHMRHQGAKDADAFDGAMSLPLGELKTYFTPESDGDDPDDVLTGGDSETGKDDSAPATGPTT